MWSLTFTLFCLVAAGLLYFCLRLYHMRTRMYGLPSTPRKNWLFGNIDVPTDCSQRFPFDAHPHCYFRYIEKKYGTGKFIYQDWWPVSVQWLYTCDPEVTSKYFTTDQSLPKSFMETDYLRQFLGKNNMVSIEGDHWKTLRAAFNPGFSNAHLMTLVPYIVDASLVYHDVLTKKAKSNELFQLEDVSTMLTVDIIGKMVLNVDFNAQTGKNPIVQTFRDRAELMPIGANLSNPLNTYNPLRPLWLWLNARRLDRLIGDELDKNVALRAKDTSNASSEKPSSKTRKRSIVDLALDQYQKDLKASGKAISATTMPTHIRNDIVDSAKTFIFAGHDTTASTMCYIFYQLHTHPAAQKKVIAELDAVFGPDPSQTATQIKEDPYIVNKLDYLMAVIKEALRIHPPASTMRQVDTKEALFFTDPDTGAQLPLNGFAIWPMAIWIQRNEDFFPEPTKFVPERFLPGLTPYKEAKLFAPEGKEAFRAFEKGPRSCIGQGLAILEMQIACALTLRTFDFVAEFDGKPIHRVTEVESVEEYEEKHGIVQEWGRGKTIEGHRAYQILKGAAAKPAGGMPGRVYIRS